MKRYIKSLDRKAPNLVDTENVDFKELHCVLDSHFRSLRSEGVGAEVKHASLITKEEESVLWDQGVMSYLPHCVY